MKSFAATELDNKGSNRRGARIIGIGIGATGLLIIFLAILSPKYLALVGGMGALVLIVGFMVFYKNLDQRNK